MKLYLCRWPNGDFSIVAGRTREEVDFILDEVGNPDAARLVPLNCFSAHFSLRGFADGKAMSEPTTMEAFEFSHLGEHTFDSVCSEYPAIDTAVCGREPQILLRQAVEVERNRYRNLKNHKPLSIDPSFRKLQKQADFPLSLIDAAARDAAELRKKRSTTETTKDTNSHSKRTQARQNVAQINCYECDKAFSGEGNRSDVRRQAAGVGWSTAVPEWAAQTPAVSKNEWWKTHQKGKTVDICPKCIAKDTGDTQMRMYNARNALLS